MKIYLAGPMRGIPEFNHPAFFAAEEKLTAAGHEVFSPARHDREKRGLHTAGMTGISEELASQGFSLEKALATDLAYICTEAEAVVLMEGWESSLGAQAEVAVARALGKPYFLLDDFLATSCPGPS